MEEQFTHIATITYQHNFFENKTFKELITVISSQAGYKVLQDLGLLIKQFLGGIHILSSDIEKLQLEEESFISFDLNCSNPTYVNYTQFPADYHTGDILHFNNRNVDPLENEDHKLKQLHYTHTSKNETFRQQLFAIIKLYPNMLYSHYVAQNSVVNYVLRFEARKTFWRYIIGSSLDFRHFKIQDEDNKVSFDKSIRDDGKLILTSNVPIALSEKPKIKFQLVNKLTNELEKVIVKPLPIANAEQLFRDEAVSSSKVYSHLYIDI